MRKEKSAAYQRAHRWKKAPLKARMVRYGAKRKPRTIWTVKPVDAEMREWVKDGLVRQAEQEAVKKNRK